MDKELANIRKKFSSSSSLSSYQRKKYVWKLVYIFVLGYDVDFGHAEVVQLVSSSKYSEKQVGYVALSLLLKGGDQMLSMVVNSIRNDLTNSSSNNDAAQSLALCSIANVSGLELAQALHVEVQQTLVSKDTTPCVRKKAALCLLRLVRTSPDLVAGREFAPHIANLLQDRHLGVITSSMSLLIGLATQHEKEYEILIPCVIHILGMLVVNKASAREYLYYRTPSPWLQIKLLKFLQFYPEIMMSDKPFVTQLQQIISKILTETDVSDSLNKSNADHAILFEAVNLIVVWGASGPAQQREAAMRLLGKFISVREPNIRYLGLMTMARLAQLEGSNQSIKKHQATVLVSLRDADISVRKRALDLLFVMCDTDNAEQIVDELVSHLVNADAAIREEMVLKIAILAEKYATDLRWYVDTILKLITISGDHVSDSIWHRVVQIITNHPQGDLQAYAAATLLVAASPRRCHETAVRVAAYVLGEFGFLIAERPGMSGEEQFRVLHQHWPTVNKKTRSILLSSYAKLANLYEECRPLVSPVFSKNKDNVDVEIQQRSCEYEMMRVAFSPEQVEDLLREMPPFEDKQSPLASGISQGNGTNRDDEILGQAPSPSQQSINNMNSTESQQNTLPPIDEDDDEGDVPSSRGNGSSYSNGARSRNVASPRTNDAIGIPKEIIPAMRKAFSNLCTSEMGVLFENRVLQVGIKHRYEGSQGTVSCFFGNLSESPLKNLHCQIDHCDHLRMEIQGTPGIVEDGCDVKVKTQAKLRLNVQVIAPYDDAPALRVIFEHDGNLYDYPLRLPIVATCFMEPVSLEYVKRLHVKMYPYAYIFTFLRI